MASHVMLDCLANFSRSNLPLLLLDEMENRVSDIWTNAGRWSGVRFRAGEVSLQELLSYAQNDNFDGILLRLAEELSGKQQILFADLLKGMTATQRGKFVLTSVNPQMLDPELQDVLCKITFPFNFDASALSETVEYAGEIG